MAYTPFALLAASLMVAMAFTSINEVQLQPDSPEKTNTLQKGVETTQANYAVDSLVTFIDVESGSHSKTEVNNALQNLTESGVYNSNQERSHILDNYTQDVEKQFSNLEEAQSRKLNVTINNLTVKTESEKQVSFSESSKTFQAVGQAKVSGATDPILTSYSKTINACSYNSLAEKLYEGSQSQGTVRGEALVEPGNPFSESSKDSKIIVTSDITQYSNTTTDDFLGYFSENEPSNPDNYNNNYTVGASSTPQLENGTKVIIHQGFWNSNFQKAIDTSCYMPSHLEETPSIYDRINESTRGDTNQGIYTVLSPTSSESDIGYQRVDNSSISIVEIEAVSESGAWPDFRMGRNLAEATGLSDLIK